MEKQDKSQMVVGTSVFSGQEFEIDISDCAIKKMCDERQNPVVKNGDKIIVTGCFAGEWFVVGVAPSPIGKREMALWVSQKKGELKKLNCFFHFFLS